MSVIIGITPYLQKGRTEYRLPRTYVESIIAAGSIPYILPVVTDKRIISRYLDSIDGLLLAGGVDPDPLYYGEEPLPGMGEIDPERDYFEIELTREALNRPVPVLGICRGCQILNVVAGGTLIQDLGEGYFKHLQDAPGWYPTHNVEIEENSLLNRVFNEKIIKVNSIHHQAIGKVGKGFRVTARARDGVIEAIEGDGAVFSLGVQWHPERMWEKNRKFLGIFREFINSCGR